ncbi:hypothetical protein P154DRAFT_523828 [Amniculicola lignicola CBS 123094]|uniref:Uncharacterized protein n=1 Tax=Amniculicola lignicola CBS 123094 TaxID=1392246 RepID=A0A6A5WA53_9PLEO|nr:hypothetical protein P154DRAFT_523828 [Amniculicola lignicola CBS 123094]
MGSNASFRAFGHKHNWDELNFANKRKIAHAHFIHREYGFLNPESCEHYARLRI